jgi:hypothetical protein
MCTKAFDTFAWPTGTQTQTFRVEKMKSPVQNLQAQFASKT